MKLVHALILIPFLAACQSPMMTRPGSEAPDMAAPDAADVDATDAEAAAEDEGETPPPAQGMATGRLGLSIATLGAAAEQGLWLKTPLVGQPQMGRVRASDTGQEIALQLIPTGGEPGSGSRLSLQAMQRLGLPLTALAEVEVFGG